MDNLRHMHSEHVWFVIAGTCHSAQNQMMMTCHILQCLNGVARGNKVIVLTPPPLPPGCCTRLGSAYLGSLSSKLDIVGDEI